jgi:hypothetical protein
MAYWDSLLMKVFDAGNRFSIIHAFTAHTIWAICITRWISVRHAEDARGQAELGLLRS